MARIVLDFKSCMINVITHPSGLNEHFRRLTQQTIAFCKEGKCDVVETRSGRYERYGSVYEQGLRVSKAELSP